MQLKLILPGNPLARARARIGKWGGYDPQAKEMEKMRFLVKQQISGEYWKLPIFEEGPLAISMEFYVPIPKSISKVKKKALEGKFSTKKPDLDNYIKATLDYLTDFIYPDDNVISQVKAYKIHSLEPKTKIVIDSVCSTTET